jgi:hypothetical protein
MKEIKGEKTTTEYYSLWEASDGTKFTDKAECEKYEASAKCVLQTKFNKLIINDEYDAWTLLGGYEDTNILAVKMNTEADKDAVLQYLYLEHPYLAEEQYKKAKETIDSKVETAYSNNDVLLLGKINDDLYVIDARINIVNRLLSLDKTEESK